MLTQTTDIITDSSCWRIIDLDMTLSSCLGPDVTMPQVTAPATQIGIALAQHLLELQHGLKCLSKTLSSAWSLLVTGTSDISSEPDCCRAKHQDMAFSGRPGPDNTMALEHRHGHSLKYRPRAILWSLGATWTQNRPGLSIQLFYLRGFWWSELWSLLLKSKHSTHEPSPQL